MLSRVVICCVSIPLVLWAIGQTAVPVPGQRQHGRGRRRQAVGSLLIAQPFTKDEYFQPRPSAASYDASASTSSALRLQLCAARPRRAHARADRQIRERSQGGPSGRAGYRGVVPAGQVPGQPAYRRAVGRHAQQPGAGLGERRPDARRLRRRLGEDASRRRGQVGSRTIPARRSRGGRPGGRVLRDFSKENPGKFPSAVTTDRSRTASRRPPSSRSGRAPTSSRSSSTCGGRTIPTSR